MIDALYHKSKTPHYVLYEKEYFLAEAIANSLKAVDNIFYMDDEPHNYNVVLKQHTMMYFIISYEFVLTFVLDEKYSDVDEIVLASYLLKQKDDRTYDIFVAKRVVGKKIEFNISFYFN